MYDSHILSLSVQILENTIIIIYLILQDQQINFAVETNNHALKESVLQHAAVKHETLMSNRQK